MSSPWRQLPEPARGIATAAADAVEAARSRDREALREAAGRLAVRDPEQVGLVLGAVVRSLLEDLHPEGLTGDDVRAVLERCVRSAVVWLPEVDAAVVTVLLTGALGVHQTDEDQRPPTGPDVALHAPVLVADLLTATGRPLAGYLATAFAEIARTETMEMP
jgi:hypothetical protein